MLFKIGKLKINGPLIIERFEESVLGSNEIHSRNPIAAIAYNLYSVVYLA